MIPIFPCAMPAAISQTVRPPVVLLTFAQIQTKITAWKAAFPDLVHVGVLGKTRDGQEIPLVRVGPGATPPDALPEILMLAGIHPREQQPPICLLRFVDELLDGQKADPKIKELLRTRTLWLVPMFNVDGKLFEEKTPDWRKNRARNPDGTVGVDLNRNFSVRWGGGRAFDATWKTTTDTSSSDIYEGPGALSEPETRALVAFFESRPNLRAFLDIHSPLREILFPAHTIAPDHARFLALAKAMRDSQTDDPYPITTAAPNTEPAAGTRGGNSGLTYTQAFYRHGVYGFNFEISIPNKSRGVAGRYPTSEAISREYDANVKAPFRLFLQTAPTFPPRREGRARPLSDGSLASPATPGATIGWNPPEFDAPDATPSFAILTSENPQVTVSSEYRNLPARTPFTLEIQKTARPGEIVWLTLTVWDDARGRTIHRFPVTIATP